MFHKRFKEMRKGLVSLLVVLVFSSAMAVDGSVGIVHQNVGPAPRGQTEEELLAQVHERTQYRDFLLEELATIEEKITVCTQEKKKWKTATILGGIGVVATGAAAIGQKVAHDKQENNKSANQTTDKK